MPTGAVCLGSSVNSSAFKNRLKVGVCQKSLYALLRKMNHIFLFEGNFEADLRNCDQL